MAFGARLVSAMRQWGPLCVGIDPHPELLAQWGLRDTRRVAHRVRGGGPRGVVALGAAVKPNSAFFERHGSRGVAALEHVLEPARELGMITILDAKRGDIGSTMEGYADAYLAGVFHSRPMR